MQERRSKRVINMKTERKRSKLKTTEVLELTALSSVTLTGPQTHTHCLGPISDIPLSHKKRAAKPGGALSGTKGALAHRE